jgi:hypothetical protein
MSLFPVFNFVPVTYKAQLYTMPVSLLSHGATYTNKNEQVGPPFKAQIVNADVDWINTYPGQAVTFVLQNSQNGGPLLDKITMVYLDNTQNPANATLIWLDTQQAINIPAFSAGYFPVFTSQYTCNLFNGTSGKGILATTAQTTVQFCNFAIPPGIIQEGASTTGFFNNQLQETTLPVHPILAANTNYIVVPAVVGTYYVVTSFDITVGGLVPAANGQLFQAYLLPFDINSVPGTVYWSAGIFVDTARPVPVFNWSKPDEQIVFPVSNAVGFQISAGTFPIGSTVNMNVSYRAVLL